jgi:hypothetical protein
MLELITRSELKACITIVNANNMQNNCSLILAAIPQNSRFRSIPNRLSLSPSPCLKFQLLSERNPDKIQPASLLTVQYTQLHCFLDSKGPLFISTHQFRPFQRSTFLVTTIGRKNPRILCFWNVIPLDIEASRIYVSNRHLSEKHIPFTNKKLSSRSIFRTLLIIPEFYRCLNSTLLHEPTLSRFSTQISQLKYQPLTYSLLPADPDQRALAKILARDRPSPRRIRTAVNLNGPA